MVRLLTPRRLAALVLAALTLAAAGASPALAGDALKGKQVFSQQCSTCHAAAKGAAPILGPTLWGVVGRPTATLPGFAYSKAMKGAGGVWDEARLRTYLPGPQKLIPGIRMTYPGLKNPAQLDDLIAYLKTLK
ncbi:cytochrome c family protein [Phenylobacterium sp. 20VBR1]|uniref:Cytochrome c family protein n=2 Tax=Phenylobacterium glaciei TaxID=2803784 RepID=A0A941HXT7_9CAUL|nr:cytochrome c family protein [Phenylobacterium glaciei]MBR7621436.1 cytochrome c family protein [Phenylobacterium glaciei]